jgi:hypothetical protein
VLGSAFVPFLGITLVAAAQLEAGGPRRAVGLAVQRDDDRPAASALFVVLLVTDLIDRFG